MDPVTQGLFGALWAASSASPGRARPALLVGAVAGMAPDLDYLIRSDRDPLLELEFHRHFTHALLFTPVGALLVALLLWPFFRARNELFGRLYLWAFLGYLSHGFLDCFTSYGTSWLWPLSEVRLAWDWMSIIDPLFSLPLAAILLITIWRKQPSWARHGLVFAGVYLLYGGWQHHQALEVQSRMIEQRAGQAERRRVMPSLGNVLVWRSVYRDDDAWVVDAIRVSPLAEPLVWPGARTAVFENSPLSRTHAEDIQRYRHFTQNYLATGPEVASGEPVLSDVRYAVLPQSTHPLWAIVLESGGGVRNATHLTRDARLATEFWNMIKGTPCEPPRCEQP